MKIWFIADSHFGVKSDDDTKLNDFYSYYNDVLIPYMRKNVKPDDMLVHLGDIFDNRSYIGTKTIWCAYNVFEQFSHIFNDIRICVGNHDMVNKNSTEMTPLLGIKYMPHTKIYYEPEVETIGGKKILFIPWIEDLKKQKEVISNYDVDYVFGHLQISGCITNVKGSVMSGDEMSQAKDFKKAQVYAGHIHIRQDYKNIHYVGNPYHKDKGDIDNAKGITILDLDTGESDFIENTYSPQYIKENIYDILEETVADVKKRWNNNYVDIEIKKSDAVENQGSLEAFRLALGDCYKGYHLKYDNTEGMVSVDEEKLVGEAKSSGDLLEDYVNACDIESGMKDSVKEWLKKFKDRL